MKDRIDNFYFELLKYGKENLQNGLNMEDVYQLAIRKGFLTEQEHNNILKPPDEGILDTTKVKENVLSYLYVSCFDGIHPSENIDRRILKHESLFNYIEYVELTEARSSAKHAQIVSWIAIFLTVLALIVSTALNYHSIKIAQELAEHPTDVVGTVNIEEAQLNKIENLLVTIDDGLGKLNNNFKLHLMEAELDD